MARKTPRSRSILFSRVCHLFWLFVLGRVRHTFGVCVLSHLHYAPHTQHTRHNISPSWIANSPPVPHSHANEYKLKYTRTNPVSRQIDVAASVAAVCNWICETKYFDTVVGDDDNIRHVFFVRQKPSHPNWYADGKQTLLFRHVVHVLPSYLCMQRCVCVCSI